MPLIQSSVYSRVKTQSKAKAKGKEDNSRQGDSASVIISRKATFDNLAHKEDVETAKAALPPPPAPPVPRAVISCKEACRELSCSSIWESLKDSCKKLRPGLWSLYIETFLIPRYRYEWQKYAFWDLNVRALTLEEKITRRQKKTQRRTDRYSFQEKYKFNTVEYSGHPHDHKNCARIRINVSGAIYETQLRTLHRFPNTLLGNPERRLPFYDPNQELYYFDRHRESFEMILYYYQSGGRLLKPDDIDMGIFYSELIFFDMGEDALNDFRDSEGLYADAEEVKILPKNLFQRKMWLLFEYPESSPSATVVAVASVLTIVLSITAFCIETMPQFEADRNNSAKMADSDLHVSEVFDFIESVCVTWFTMEFIARLVSSPLKFRFCSDIMNIIDFVAIVPYFVTVAVALNTREPADDNSDKGGKKSSSEPLTYAVYLQILKVIRLVRVFRIFKLSRHSKGLQILGLTLQASLRELGLLIFFLVIGVILFSSAIYFAELEEPHSMYKSIPHSFYWGVITMTTVGYGDFVPLTNAGKLIGTFCAVAGVLTIALPVPVIVSNFNFFYSRSKEKKKVEINLYNPNHVQMCPFLPGNGIHPEAPPEYDGTLENFDRMSVRSKTSKHLQGQLKSVSRISSRSMKIRIA